jgi:uncharacterized protein YjdB
MQIAPAQAELQVGEEVELSVAFLPTPAPNVQTPTPVWTSSAPLIVSVSPSGTATALTPGSAVVTAQAGTLAASTVVTVLRAPVASMQLKAPERALEVGVTEKLTCVILDAQGQELTDREVFWASSTPRVATANADGEVTALAIGRTTIGATCEAHSATVNIDVVPDRVADFGLAPATLSLQERESGRLSIRANNARGKPIAGRPVLLRSADPAIAVVGPDGAVTGRAVGRTTITGTIEGQTASAEVVVRPAAVATITVTPAAPSVKAGDTVAFAAAMYDATGHALPGRTVAWSSSDGAALAIDQNGRAVAARAGSVEVTAKCEGVAAAVRVAIAPAPIVALDIAPPGKPLHVGKRVRLRARARDATGHELEPNDITWRSTNADVATVGPDGTVTAVAAGDVTILGTVGEHEARATLSIGAAPPPRRIPIALPIGGGAVALAVAGVLLFARRDNGPVRPQPTVPDTAPPPNVSSGPDTAVIQPPPPSGLVTSAGVPDTTNATVVAAIRVTSRNPLVLESGETGRVIVRATNSDGGIVSSPLITWTSTDSSTVRVSANGTVSARTEGRASVVATAGDVTARVEVVVSSASPATIAIAPRTGSVRVGETTRLTTRVQDRGGNVLLYRAVWRSSNTGLATVDDAGTVHGVRAGEVMILALAGGATDSVRVTVTPAASVAVAPAPVTPDPTPVPATTVRAVDKPADVVVAPSGASAAQVEAAMIDAARTLGDGFGRGQLGQLTATSPFSKLVRVERPQVTGPPVIRRRSVDGARAEGDVELPLRGKDFVGRNWAGPVVLHIVLEQRDGTWRPTSIRNTSMPR